MTDLGSYITHEYGLLTSIFSYLSAKELLVASKVCKEWHDLALRMLAQNNVPKSYIKRENSPWSGFSEKIHPKLIIHFSLNTQSEECLAQNADLIEYMDTIYNINGNTVYNIVNNSWFIGSEIKQGKLAVFNERCISSQSVLMIPEMRGVEIEVFPVETRHLVFPQQSYRRINSETVARSKCFLLFANPRQSNLHVIRNIMASFPNPQTLVMAGGIAMELYKMDIAKDKECTVRSVGEQLGILGVSIRGENVTAHSDLHNLSTDIHDFLKNFAKAVGPKPPGSERIAFMFVCVDRTCSWDSEETDYFSKYFPDVPVYGFGSLGEYCIRNPNIDDNVEHKRKKVKSTSYKTVKNLKYAHEQCTAYLVITFNKF